MSIKIYTRKGDQGFTSLLGGRKISKGDLRIETYGTLDELNSFLGWAGDLQPDSRQAAFLRRIQDRLFTIGSRLACDPEKLSGMSLPSLEKQDILDLERCIDLMDSDLPLMKSFLLPGGHPAVSACHIARCVCRRAERLCVRLGEQDTTLDPLILGYLNRLSDYLFMLARHTAKALRVEEIKWLPAK